jgi:hypothetical protein
MIFIICTDQELLKCSNKGHEINWAGSMHERHEKCVYLYIILLGKPEGKRALGRLRCSWEDNVSF